MKSRTEGANRALFLWVTKGKKPQGGGARNIKARAEEEGSAG
jgi:hypothetical protein